MEVARVWLTESELLALGIVSPQHRVFYGPQLGQGVILHFDSQCRTSFGKSKHTLLWRHCSNSVFLFLKWDLSFSLESIF